MNEQLKNGKFDELRGRTKELVIKKEGRVLKAHGEQWNVNVVFKMTEWKRKLTWLLL